MVISDLPAVRCWLLEPHVARWWSDEPDQQLGEFEQALSGLDPTHLLIIERAGQPVGWCQWYRWADSPDEAPAYGATDRDLGFDYAIGEPGDVGRGLGTEVIARLTGHIRCTHPLAPIVVAVAVTNTASRRVLEKNDFVLVAERVIASEPGDGLTALYRLAGGPG